ncbi:MAG: hypothetical protein Q4E53_03805 [Eubacteriales bacterium]|nr:hypothetical protein [Eubacteriales bacterium]
MAKFALNSDGKSHYYDSESSEWNTFISLYNGAQKMLTAVDFLPSVSVGNQTYTSCNHIHKDELTKVEEKAPTCTEDGRKEYYECTECGMWFADETAETECIDHNPVIPALGHESIIDEAKAPRCTKKGLTEGSHCGRCGKVLVKQKKIPAKGHVDEDGNKYCDECNTYLGKKKKH